ncbi:dynactin subunit 4 [Toxorhynchites rutilus septentrionalis]|uniref:dynactin subunit 4 n=1 Tax=Toxorhynchites rutilus septentrionalis TaxID=329112 RepID=UPI00247A38E0|nr:dynactin subunit 4 [Toxorhynchites rutilus septentrionalis]
MAFFMFPNVVEYACVCGLLNPLTKLYFCRYCMKLRCGFCVCHEVDSHFCSNCLENIPSSEAKIRKNRCNTCFNCPSCQHTLSVRASNAPVPAVTAPGSSTDNQKKESTPEPAPAKQVTRKMYYLACLNCRWSSRDVGIPDQTVATGQWPEPEYSNATRFAMLLEHYQSVVLHEKQEKQELWRRKTPKQSKFPSLTDRTGLTVSMIRRQMGWTDSKTQIKATPSAINRSVASENVAELPLEILTKEINLKSITTVQQRLSQPAKQPSTVNKLYPQHKLLSIKRSLRCRQCDHNVIKSEYNPSSIKYRIAMFATYHVPEVRFVKCDPLKAGTESTLVLKLINPTINDMTITIMELPTEEDEKLMIEELKAAAESSASSSLMISGLSSSLAKQATLLEDPRIVEPKVNGSFRLPDSSFVINHRDDSAEFDEVVQSKLEDPKFIVWRKANQIAIKLAVQPRDGCQPDDDIFIGFSLQYTYVNTVVEKSGTPTKGPLMQALTTRVYIKLPKATSNVTESV